MLKIIFFFICGEKAVDICTNDLFSSAVDKYKQRGIVDDDTWVN